MKLRHIYIFVLLPVLLGADFGCSKDVLDQNPKTTISDATFWKTVNDLKLYCNNFYQLLPTNPSNNAFYYTDNNSDHLVPSARNIRLNGETVVPASGGGWSYNDWANIRNANYFLTHYQSVSATQADIAPYLGEAYFFRAWFYFEKLISFGAVPWISQPLSTGDEELLSTPRTPRNIVADSIVADIDSAISLLPSRTVAQSMRINKEIAQAFKTRVCLYEGTWEKYHNGTDFGVSGQDGSKFLQEAAEEAEALMGNAAVGLDNVGDPDGYQKLFNQVDYSSSKEILFWRAYEVGILTTAWNRYSNTGGGTGMTRRMVGSYLCTDGKPISVSDLYQGDDSLETVVRDRDPRLRQTLYVPGDLVTAYPGNIGNVIFERPGFTLAHDQLNTTGYQLKKGNNTDPAQIDYTTRGLIFIRFAEVLLNFAEAKAELGTLTQDDLDRSINLLRGRVGMPSLLLNNITTDTEWDFPGLSAIINEVRREREVELACEGFRFNDIMRWAAAPQLIIGYKPKGAKWAQWEGQYPTLIPGNNIFLDDEGYLDPYHTDELLTTGYHFKEDRDYLLPLPVDQLTLNPDLRQNPGW